MKRSIQNLIGLILLCGNLSACTHQYEKKLEAVLVGEQKLLIEIADTEEKRRLGLMFRKILPENQGMLFVMKKTGRVAFWMKNTSIPLDVAYINAEFFIEEIHSLEPHDLRGVPSRSDNILYALEVNQGYFEKHNIKPGSKVIYPLRN